MNEVLVTGGAGYIGSHMCVELLQAGYDVVVVDNLSNSSARSLQAVQRIADRSLTFIEADLRDRERMARVFTSHEVEAVIHFAGLKAVGESVAQPLRYYDNNVGGTVALLQAMAEAEVKTLVFSSSATVYGIPDASPVAEDAPTRPINPYGQTKVQIEQILSDLHVADPTWHISMLRYFNPVGAHSSGDIGEDPTDTPNNLMPFIAQVAVGRRPKLRIFGDDYDTIDGTGVRDYIHVVDLVRGHLKALEYLQRGPRLTVHNLGTGTGHSVMQVLQAFERTSETNVPYEVVERRPGDAALCFADVTRAQSDLHWQAEFDLDRMCADTWHWQQKHPFGYRAEA